MNKRNLRLEKYGISGKRYKELCGFCEQYPEWKQAIKFNTDTLHSPEITDMPLAPHDNMDDATSRLAIKRAYMSQCVDLVDNTAKQAGGDLSKYIILSVCYETNVTALRHIHGMPLEKSAFYELRRYFFYLLDKNKDF